MNYQAILNITENFYELAKVDVMIGYHFRFIKDFDSHIPRIADFWNLQLNGKMHDRSHLPYELLNVHRGLGIKKGEIGRWMVLFQKALQQGTDKNIISQTQQNRWLDEIEKFKKIIEEKIVI